MKLNRRNKYLLSGVFLWVGLVAPHYTASLLANPRGAAMKIDAQVESPRIVGVRIRHDRCPICKAVDPLMPQLIHDIGDGRLLLITLDLSDQSTQQQAALLVGALGLNSVWSGDLSKIGSFTFLAWPSKRLISTVQSSDYATIRNAAKEAIATQVK